MKETQWNVGKLAQSGAEVLGKRGFDSPRLESDLLLAEVLGLERLELFTRFDMPVDDESRGAFRALIKRRLANEPIAYILGKRDFLDLTFSVGPGVLIPRPETEHVVHASQTFLDGVSHPRFLEVGVGSGCITLSLLHHNPHATALALDISEAALACTLKNAEALGLADRLTCLQSDVFKGISEDSPWLKSLDLIVSNPPYIRQDEKESLAKDVRDYEPGEALFCPEDGLAFHRMILRKGPAFLKDSGGIVLELACGTGKQLLQFAQTTWSAARHQVLPDYSGLDRVSCHTKSAWPEGFSSLHGAQVTSEEEPGS